MKCMVHLGNRFGENTGVDEALLSILRDPHEKTRKRGILRRGIPREEKVARKKRGKISLLGEKINLF